MKPHQQQQLEKIKATLKLQKLEASLLVHLRRCFLSDWFSGGRVHRPERRTLAL